jgi:hypothetical protein
VLQNYFHIIGVVLGSLNLGFLPLLVNLIYYLELNGPYPVATNIAILNLIIASLKNVITEKKFYDLLLN